MARTQRRSRVTLSVAAVALAGLVAACANAHGSAVAGGRQAAITESGSGLLYPLASTWASAYHQQFPAVTVTTASTGSGAGIALASAGKVDIGASDAYLSSGDLVKNPSLLNIPLAISAQTIIYNMHGLSAGRRVRLNGTVLAGIFEGTITSWADPAITTLNPGLRLPPVKIVPVRRSDSSGDTFLFTSYLSTQDPQWNNWIGYGTTVTWPQVPGEIAARGSESTMSVCESTPGCLAYNGISYLSRAQRGGLGEAALANSAGRFTLPTPGAIRDSVASFVSITPPDETISMIDGPAVDGYPIVNYEYVLVSTRQPDAARARMIRAFLTWVITRGNAASYLDPVGFAPLPATVASLGLEQIAEIGR